MEDKDIAGLSAVLPTGSAVCIYVFGAISSSILRPILYTYNLFYGGKHGRNPIKMVVGLYLCLMHYL